MMRDERPMTIALIHSQDREWLYAYYLFFSLIESTIHQIRGYGRIIDTVVYHEKATFRSRLL
jgi:hypothetical protein